MMQTIKVTTRRGSLEMKALLESGYKVTKVLADGTAYLIKRVYA